MEITPELLLNAYRNGYFPMAETKDADELIWFNPLMRAHFDMENFHVPRSLQREINKGKFTVTVNKNFSHVIKRCADIRDDTWINAQIIELYETLHEMGYGVSFEVWDGAEIIGGLYGVAINRAFFAESMYSEISNASKFALEFSVRHLRECGFVLYDTQFANEHLKQFGIIETPREEFKKMLDAALEINPKFPSPVEL